ncbi:MAG TPA: hypothetical protein VMC86_05065 [Gemmatimonadales bacterium]|nr:hypothetical protein [Gemmatimonadales bacterium]
MRPLTPFAVLALLLGASACATTYDATRLGVPVTLADSSQAPAGTPFRVTKHPVFVLWGLVTASEPNLEDLFAGQLGAGASLTRVRIHSRMTWSDLLFTVITAGFVSPRSVTFEGQIVGGAGAGPAPTASH